MERWNEFYEILVTDFKFHLQVSLWTYVGAVIPSQILYFLGYGHLTTGYTTIVVLVAVAYVLTEGANDNWMQRIWAHLFILWVCYVCFILLFNFFFEKESKTTWHVVLPVRTSVVRLRHPESYLMAFMFMLFELFIIFYMTFAYVSFIRFAMFGFEFSSRRSGYPC